MHIPTKPLAAAFIPHAGCPLCTMAMRKIFWRGENKKIKIIMEFYGVHRSFTRYKVAVRKGLIQFEFVINRYIT